MGSFGTMTKLFKMARGNSIEPLAIYVAGMGSFRTDTVFK